jgi:hypothetical protein
MVGYEGVEAAFATTGGAAAAAAADDVEAYELG